MTAIKRVGFRPSWMDGDPQYDPVESSAVSSAVSSAIAPPQLLELRRKIAQLTIFMSTTAFSKMKKGEKLELIMEYAELNSIESGYTAAVLAATGAGE